MIITRTPLRISFCGGGSDMPDYYLRHDGCVISTSINKYMYITLARSFHQDVTQLKYSAVERVKDLSQIQHPIFRETLKKYGVSGVEITSTSEIPSGTGLGSSSAFTVGLINGIRTLCGMSCTKALLAEEACDMEINRLGEPVGKQDQYAAAFGGLNYIQFKRDGAVEVTPIQLAEDDLQFLSDRLMMFYLGGTRNASEILKEYSVPTTKSAEKKTHMCELVQRLYADLSQGRIEALGRTLDDGWQIKRSLAPDISNGFIDDVYRRAMASGAVGGKLLGAGGNGFMLFYVDPADQNSVRQALSDCRQMAFRFDHTGSSVVYNDEI